MRGNIEGGGFTDRLRSNMLLNLKWAAPGIILIILHFVTGFPLFVGAGIVGVWMSWMIVISSRSPISVGERREPEKENKNPYSGLKKTDDTSGDQERN